MEAGATEREVVKGRKRKERERKRRKKNTNKIASKSTSVLKTKGWTVKGEARRREGLEGRQGDGVKGDVMGQGARGER